MVDLRVIADDVVVPAGERVEVAGRGDVRVVTTGHGPGDEVDVRIGGRWITLQADDHGVAEWHGPRLLAQVAGEVRVGVGDLEALLVVRPDKLVSAAIVELIEELEQVGEGLAQDAGAVASMGQLRSREHDLQALDRAVGLAASAAPAIRRRPIHRAREVVRAVPSDKGPRRAADVRWLATHPVAAVRAAAAGRPVGVSRERRADLDTIENRGVLSAYDQLDSAVSGLRRVVEAEVSRLEAARPARESFLTDGSNLWQERDQPRHDALTRRRERLASLSHEVAATRLRVGLPNLTPRASRMVRTARVDAEPAYWTTFRAFEMAERAQAGEAPPAAAPVRALDELWEQWVTVAIVRTLSEHLGPPRGRRLVDPGWFATMRRGTVATWDEPRRTIVVDYEPTYEYGRGEVRKLHPGRPWRPDVVIEVRWLDGTIDLHLFDAKYRLENGGPPKEALRELWWKYGEGIGDFDRRPVVRSVWACAPGDGVWLVGPTMLSAEWPADRLRGGIVSLAPKRTSSLLEVLGVILAAG